MEKHTGGTFCALQDEDKAAPPTEPKLSRISHANHKHSLSHTCARSWASIWIIQLCISNIVLCPPTQGTSSRVWKSQEINQCLRLHFLHLSHGRPAVPSQHNAVESQQRIDKAEGIKTCKESKFASLCVCGWKWSYLAADDEGTLKKPALRLESLHSSSSLMRRWKNGWGRHRYVATLFSPIDTLAVSMPRREAHFGQISL